MDERVDKVSLDDRTGRIYASADSRTHTLNSWYRIATVDAWLPIYKESKYTALDDAVAELREQPLREELKVCTTYDIQTARSRPDRRGSRSTELTAATVPDQGTSAR